SVIWWRWRSGRAPSPAGWRSGSAGTGSAGASPGGIPARLGGAGVFLGGGAVGLAAFVNAMINLRQAASAKPGPFNLRSIPSSFGAILANPKAKFCFLAVFLEGVAVFGLFPFV